MTPATDGCSMTTSRRGRGCSRCRRCTVPRRDSLHWEGRHGEAELRAASAGFGVAGGGDTVRRPAAAGVREREREEAGEGAEDKERGRERQGTMGVLLTPGSARGGPGRGLRGGRGRRGTATWRQCPRSPLCRWQFCQ